jgi:phage portal protein BeeE
MLANLLKRPAVVERAQALSFSQYARLLQSRFSFAGHQYVVGGLDQSLAVQAMSNAALAAVIGVRAKVFSEITFKWQRYDAGRLGALFGTQELEILERPWANAHTVHLLNCMSVDGSVYGNSYWIVRDGELLRLDPLNTNIATVEVVDPESGVVVSRRLAGYMYRLPNSKEFAFFLPDEVAHYREGSDPENCFRGTSWLRAVLADADADSKMTTYKQALLDNSAVPGLIMRAEPGVSEEQFLAARDIMAARHTGPESVGKTLVLGAGFDVSVVGQNMQQLDMKAIQGAGETRIAAAAGVPASIVGFSEGLQGSALNAGNYGATRRRFADGTMRPLWRSACAALSTVVATPIAARLWYDERDVAFLQEDVKDEASIRREKALTIEALIRAGFRPDAAAEFTQTGDEAALFGQHTGLFSVQLQPPTAGDMESPSGEDEDDSPEDDI